MICTICETAEADKGFKTCSSCREKKRTYARNWYANNRERALTYTNNWRKENPDKIKAISRRYREKNPDKIQAWWAKNPDYRRNQMLEAEYGISLAQWNAMLVAQDYRCKLCRTTDPGPQGAFHTDHDHATNAVRGLLCHHCNALLGYAKDQIAVLLAAVEYLSSARLTYETNAANLLRKETNKNGASA